MRAADDEVVVFAGPQMMPLAEKSRDAALNLAHSLLRRGGYHDHVQPTDSRNLLLDGGVGHEQHVVLILPITVLSFCLKDPQDAEGKILHANYLANRILVAEKLLRNRITEHADIGGHVDVAIGKHAALNHRPVANLRDVL